MADGRRNAARPRTTRLHGRGPCGVPADLGVCGQRLGTICAGRGGAGGDACLPWHHAARGRRPLCGPQPGRCRDDPGPSADAPGHGLSWLADGGPGPCGEAARPSADLGGPGRSGKRRPSLRKGARNRRHVAAGERNPCRPDPSAGRGPCWRCRSGLGPAARRPRPRRDHRPEARTSTRQYRLTLFPDHQSLVSGRPRRFLAGLSSF